MNGRTGRGRRTLNRRSDDIPESPNHLQCSHTSCMDLADVATCEQLLDLVDKIRPVLREVARDDVLECTSKLYGDGAVGGCGDEGKDGCLEIVPVGGRDRDLVGARRRVDEVGRVHAIFEVNSRGLAGGAVEWFRQTQRDKMNASGTYRSTLSFPTICRTFVIIPSCPPSYTRRVSLDATVR